MAYRKVDDTSLASVADAIRAKGGTSDEFVFPDGFVSAIGSIQTGGGTESGLPSSADVTFGYVKKTETVTEQAPEGKCWYNGVLLPEIPTDVLASFPYCWMNSTGSAFIVAAYPWYYTSGKMNIAVSAENRKYSLSSDGMGWELSNTYTDTGGYTVNAHPAWANHDILNGSATATEIYFNGSEPLTELTETITNRVPVERESNYSITSEILNNIAKRTQEMAGTSKLLTPDDVIYWLNRVQFIPQGNAESSFSLSFSSSASGILPDVQIGMAGSAFTLSFSSESYGRILPELNGAKVSYNGVTLPGIPDEMFSYFPYAWIRKNVTTGYYDLIFSTLVPWYSASNKAIQYGIGSGPCVYYGVAIDSSDTADAWETKEALTTTFALDDNRTVLWSNHDIPRDSATGTEVYFAGSEPVAVTEE